MGGDKIPIKSRDWGKREQFWFKTNIESKLVRNVAGKLFFRLTFLYQASQSLLSLLNGSVKNSKNTKFLQILTSINFKNTYLLPKLFLFKRIDKFSFKCSLSCKFSHFFHKIQNFSNQWFAFFQIFLPKLNFWFLWNRKY